MICRKCGSDKPQEAMKKERVSKNSRPICKDCHNAAYRAYSAANREKVRQQKIQSNKTHRDEMRERARIKRSTPEAKASAKARQEEYLAKNPEKFRAHWMVREAVIRGNLTKPSECEHCGESGYVEGSHTDYSRPLDVEWLCPACHRKKDYALKRAESALP